MFVRKEVSDWICFLSLLRINVEITGKENKILGEWIYYLSNRNQYLFVCDMITDEELNKLIVFANKKKRPVLIAFSNGNFQIIDRFIPESEMFAVYTQKDSSLFQCTECDGFWFANNCGCWKCKNCGSYDGDHYIQQMILGDKNTIWNEVF